MGLFFFILLLTTFNFLHSEGCAILGQLYCDKCWDGYYTSNTDSYVSAASVVVNCTVQTSTGAIYYWGRGVTSSNGAFSVPVSGTSNKLGQFGADLSFLTALFNGGNSRNGQRSTSYVVGCTISVSNSPLCPNIAIDDGNIRTDGKHGNGFTSSKITLVKVSTYADIFIGTSGSSTNSVPLTPSSRSSNCPRAPPPPSGVKGDPHFIGADGSHFDFTGEPGNNYCLVSDNHVHINAFYGGRFDRWGNDPHKPLTWIRKIGVLWGKHTITMAAREGSRWQYDNGYMGHIEVDGKEVVLKEEGDSVSLADGNIEISWLAAAMKSANDLVDVYLLKVADAALLRLTVRPEVALLRTREDGVVHFNVEFAKIDLSSSAHGVLGQTYRLDHYNRIKKQELVYSKLLKVDTVPGDNAENFLDGKVEDYLSSGLLKPDCKVARFTASTIKNTDIEKGSKVTSRVARSFSKMKNKWRKIFTFK